MSEAASSAAHRAFRSEMALAAFIVVAVGLTFLEVGFPYCVPGAGLAAITLIIAFTDWRRRIIPNLGNLVAAALGLVEALLSEHWQVAAMDALTRGAAVFLLFLCFRWAFRYWRGLDGIGLGDVKLAGVLGIWLEWPDIPVAIELACLSLITFVIMGKFIYGQAVDTLTKLPFGAFLAPAIWVTWIWENVLV